MFTREFSFEYPPELVAQEGLPERDSARMIVLNREKSLVQDSSFREFPSYFKNGDVLILNNTKVLPARVWGRKKTGGKVEVLLVSRVSSGGAYGRMPTTEVDSNRWECWFRSMKGIHEGDDIIFGSQESGARSQEGVRAIFRVEKGKKVLEFPQEVSVLEWMKQNGAAPLPPYIKRSEPRDEDRERYQTIFAEREGAIAAPTASLHFTPRILSELKSRGVEILYVTLHVGIGTFQPVTAERVEDHEMQTEYYEISPAVVESILAAKKEGRPVTAVGTTTVRAVESYYQHSSDFPSPLEGEGPRRGGEGDHVMHSTNLFIHPGYKFKIIDRLLTNFHQPESTPLFLTCAFAGKEFVFRAYVEAIEKKYRLFSYGDCMFVL